MKLATTTGDFSRFEPTHEGRIRAVTEAGFRYLDLSMYNDNTAASPFMSENWRTYTEALRALADSLGATFVQAHSPGGNPLQKDNDWQMLLDSTVRSIEVCAVLGIPHTVVHAGWADGLGKEEYFERNRDFYRLLLPIAEKTGVSVLTENSTHANMGDRYYFYTGADMKEFVEYVDHPLFGVCWDTGHANIEGPQYDEICALGDTLKAVHINDNRGHADEHIMPYMGTMSLDEVIRALCDVGFKGYFTFECETSMRSALCWLGDNRRTVSGDNRLLDPPYCVAEQLEKALYICGKYALESYSIFEE